MPSSSSRGFHPPPPNQSPPHYSAHYDPDIPLSTVAASVFIGVVLVYQLLSGLLALPSPLDAIALMAGLLFGPGAREHLQATFATSPRQVVSQVRNRAASIVGGGVRAPVDTSGGTVGGLWNVGNTCYQNSVLQALASLENLTAWLQAIEDGTAAEALERMLEDLNTLKETPRAMMASSLITHASGGAKGWMFNEQQDAQEFLQGLMGVLEKEVGKVVEKRNVGKALGLEMLVSEENVGGAKPTELDPSLRSPFEGLLAQRVGCLECKYVESISLQPFTTLSLPIPSTSATTLESCLCAFTAIENIPQVDCDKCTLLAVQSRLQGLLQPTTDSGVGELPAEHRETIKTRLQAVDAALENDDFTPKIPGVKLTGAHKVSSTKTKQVKIARSPLLLVLHTNRSQFDMLTGTVGKNYAAIKFPYVLDLGATSAVTSYETLSMDLDTPMSSAGNGEYVYELKAVVSHYGGHHNGHYVSYRRWAKKWWRISDHEVIPCVEEDVLAASNAFMLFYERLSSDAVAALTAPQPSVLEELQKRPLSAFHPDDPITSLLPPTPPLSESEPDEEEETPTPTPRAPTPLKLQQQTPPPEPPADNAEEEVLELPELTPDVSSRDSSPGTPPLLLTKTPMPAGGGKNGRRKGRRKGRGGAQGGVVVTVN